MAKTTKSGSGASPGQTSNSGKALAVVALSAIAGFAAVYATLSPRDNAAIEKSDKAAAATGAQTAEPAKPGEKMAAFVHKKSPEALPEITFQDGAGKTLKLADFKGRTVLLNLWATW